MDMRKVLSNERRNLNPSPERVEILKKRRKKLSDLWEKIASGTPEADYQAEKLEINYEYINKTNLAIVKFMEYAHDDGIVVIDTTSYSNDNLPFHKDWNTLWPVIDKIERLDYSFSVKVESCQVWDKKADYHVSFGDMAGFMIDADFYHDRLVNAYSAVECFIKLYNNGKTRKFAEHTCRYSKAMYQPYPRRCIDCGILEKN